MSMTTRCRQCGREYALDRAALLAGPRVWRRCPLCRDPTPPGAAAGPSPDPRLGPIEQAAA